MPDVHVAITGTTNPDNARANIQAAEKGPLPAAAVGKILEAFRGTAAKSGEPWKGLT